MSFFAAVPSGRLYLGAAAVLVCAVSSTAPTPAQSASLIQGTFDLAGDCPPGWSCSGTAGIPGGWGGPADAWQAFTINPPIGGSEGAASASGAWVEVPAQAPAAAPPIGSGVPSGTITGPLVDLSSPPNATPAYEVITIGPAQPPGPASPAAPPPQAPPAQQPPTPSASPAAGPPGQPSQVAVGAPLPPVPPPVTAPSARPADPGAAQPAPAQPDTAAIGTAAYSNRWGTPDVVDDLGADTGLWTPALFDARQHPVAPPPGLLVPGDGRIVLTTPSTPPTTGSELSPISVATWTPAAQQGRWEARMRMHLPPGSTGGLALTHTATAPPGATPTTAPPRLGELVLGADSLPPDLDGVDLQEWHHWAVEQTSTEIRTYLDGRLTGLASVSGSAGRFQLQIQLRTTASPPPADVAATPRSFVEVDWAAHYPARR